MTDERRPARNAAANSITCADDSKASGGRWSAGRRVSTHTELRHRICVLEAEQRRSYRLLARALEVAVATDRRWVCLGADGEPAPAPASTEPTELLERIALLEGTDLARPAWVEEREAREAAA